MLTSPQFLSGADIYTRKHAFLAVLRLAKFLLSVVGHSILYMVVEAQQPNSTNKVNYSRILSRDSLLYYHVPLYQVTDATHNHAVVLQQALQAGIPCPTEFTLRQTSSRLGQSLLQDGTRHLPDLATVRAVIR